MKATKKLLWAAILAAGGTLVAVESEAQSAASRGGGSSGASARGATAGGGHMGSRGAGRGGNHGGHGGHGGHGHGGHHHGHGHGHGYWGGYYPYYPGWGFYWGIPAYWSAWYWGAPYWYDYYPGGAVIYREVERAPGYPEGEIGPATTEVPRGGGAPTQGPAYQNYCESAKAYFPRVTTCPEGWKLSTPTN